MRHRQRSCSVTVARVEADEEILAHYAESRERERLTARPSLELVRTQVLVQRYLPSPPSRVLDVGGASGVYAAWLASRGYTVRLIDPVPVHIQQAAQHGDFTAAIGDARTLEEPAGSYDAVLPCPCAHDSCGSAAPRATTPRGSRRCSATSVASSAAGSTGDRTGRSSCGDGSGTPLSGRPAPRGKHQQDLVGPVGGIDDALRSRTVHGCSSSPCGRARSASVTVAMSCSMRSMRASCFPDSPATSLAASDRASSASQLSTRASSR
jgi:hypothetical protein